MNASHPLVLTINGGSSSVKFGLFQTGREPRRTVSGQIERVGNPGTTMTIKEEKGGQESQPLASGGFGHTAESLMDWLESRPDFASIRAVGHRVVHGLNHVEPERVTPELVKELHGAETYDPDHLPGELQLIAAFSRRHPRLPQVACFDTAFHRSMPRVAQMLPIPRRYEAKGVKRYGFHGLSYSYVLGELERVAGRKAAMGRLILAHLGNGASMAAVHQGRCVDTTMAFTPAAGLVMGTRSGDLDPGLVAFLARTERMTPARFNAMVNHESGLLGVSETSADMRDLLERSPADIRAAEAVALFCYQAKKTVGAYAAALGGLDTVVFTGGIGENAAPVRAAICQGLGFLGLELEESRNASHAEVISSEASRVTVRVTRTDEELIIAELVVRLLDLSPREDAL